MVLAVRSINPSDDVIIEGIIRSVLVEFGANRPGFAWQDSALSSMNSAYKEENSHYWVATSNDEIVGGCGIAPLVPEVRCTCELQKMYISSTARGKGIGRALMAEAMSFAQLHYDWCYLETLATMGVAERLYRQVGFISLPQPLLQTDHVACDRWYLKELKNCQ